MAKLGRKHQRKQAQLRADPRRQRKLEREEGKLSAAPGQRRRQKPVDAAALQAKLDQPTTIPAVAERVRHPERRPSKAAVLQRDSYAVYIDQHRRTCLRVGAGRDLTYYIPLDSAGLDVHSLAHERFDEQYKSYAYPLLTAARRYAESAQAFGYTEKARQHLEAILSGSTSTKESDMATRKAMTKGSSKKRIVFDPKRMIVKGNAEGLKKARGAKMAGAGTKYAGRTIKALVKLDKSGLREGSKRYAMLALVLGAKKVDDVLGKKVKGTELRGNNLAGMVARKHIQLI